MDPGEFDTKVEIHGEIANGRDKAGAPIKTFGFISYAWAKVTYPGGREFFADDGENTERKVVFKLYRQRDFDRKSVIMLNEVAHDIRDIRPFSDTMELHTVARQPERV